MKKLLVLIIAIITLIGINTTTHTKPAKTPAIEPTSTVAETVKGSTARNGRNASRAVYGSHRGKRDGVRRNQADYHRTRAQTRANATR